MDRSESWAYRLRLRLRLRIGLRSLLRLSSSRPDMKALKQELTLSFGIR